MGALYLCMEEDDAGTQGITTLCSLHLAVEMLYLALFSLQPLGYAIPLQNVSLFPKLLEPEPQVFSRDGCPLWKPTLSCIRELQLGLPVYVPTLGYVYLLH